MPTRRSPLFTSAAPPESCFSQPAVQVGWRRLSAAAPHWRCGWSSQARRSGIPQASRTRAERSLLERSRRSHITDAVPPTKVPHSARESSRVILTTNTVEFVRTTRHGVTDGTNRYLGLRLDHPLVSTSCTAQVVHGPCAVVESLRGRAGRRLRRGVASGCRVNGMRKAPSYSLCNRARSPGKSGA